VKTVAAMRPKQKQNFHLITDSGLLKASRTSLRNCYKVLVRFIKC